MQRYSALLIVAVIATANVGFAAQEAKPAPRTSGQPAPAPTRPSTPARPAAPPAGHTPAPAPPAQTTSAQTAPAGVMPPPDYLIGPDDVLTIVFWRDKDISGDVIVRPDGMISLPLISEVKAAGLTPEQLRVKIVELSAKYLEDPNVVVVVKQINSRKVYITGEVKKIGAYPLTAPTTVLQLITMAGGLETYADEENIVILRTERGRPMSYKFNYKDVIKRRRLSQNILLQPGDQVVVP